MKHDRLLATAMFLLLTLMNLPSSYAAESTRILFAIDLNVGRLQYQQMDQLIDEGFVGYTIFALYYQNGSIIKKDTFEKSVPSAIRSKDKVLCRFATTVLIERGDERPSVMWWGSSDLNIFQIASIKRQYSGNLTLWVDDAKAKATSGRPLPRISLENIVCYGGKDDQSVVEILKTGFGSVLKSLSFIELTTNEEYETKKERIGE